MNCKHVLVLGAVTALGGGGAAFASHAVQVDPATVPTGVLAAHNVIGDVPVNSLARAVTPDGTEITIQHARLPANAATSWHTHPGPGIVTIVRGTLTYEDAAANKCRAVTYNAGSGFVDRGFGHVHRAVAGPEGADFYVVYVMPRGTTNPLIAAEPVGECTA
jgi:quercetin dioxygenase-like cupin family protein